MLTGGNGAAVERAFRVFEALHPAPSAAGKPTQCGPPAAESQAQAGRTWLVSMVVPASPAIAQGRPASVLAAPWLGVWRLAWPAIFHMLLLTAVFVVDRAIVGRASSVSLASLQISSVFVWTLTSIFTAFSAATLAVAGRAIGSGDGRAAARAATTSVAVALVSGALVVALARIASPSLLSLAFPRVGVAVMADVVGYLDVALYALPLVFVEAALAAVLQAAGDTRSPLRAAIVGNAFNLVISCVLVFGLLGAPALGVVGVAVGAACAAAAEVVLLALVLTGPKSPIDVRAHGVAWDGQIAARLVRVAWPAVADKAAYAGGYLVFVALISWLGAAAMAANQVISSIEAVCFLTAEGFGVAAASLVAQQLGARQQLRAESSMRLAAWMAVFAAAPFGLLFALAARPLLRAFGGENELLELGVAPLVVAGLSQPFMAYATVMRMALRGAGATRPVLVVTLAGTLLVRLPLGYLLAVSCGYGLLGVWLACLLDWVLEAGLLSLVARRSRWKVEAL